MKEPLRDSSTPPERVCAVCAYTLEYLEGVGYLHLGPVAAMHDHLPVPVDPAEVSWAPDKICDFCSQIPGTWVILVDDFIVRTGAVLAGKMAGNWYACPACVELVYRRRWAQLIDRVVDRQPRVSRRTLRDTYAQLERHMKGVALAKPDE